MNTLHMARLLEASEYYEEHGYKYVNAPWAVSREAVLMTRPPAITGEPFSYVAGGEALYPVASAEQSFLHMQMVSKKIGWEMKPGKHYAITPCFRNELKLDDMHQPYFLKLELIEWVDPDGDPYGQKIALNRMVSEARHLFTYMYKDMYEGDELKTETVPNRESDPIGFSGMAFDIQTLLGGIEIGSYGVRQHEKVGRWVYGTGLAEPRYTYAIDVERVLKTATGRPA